MRKIVTALGVVAMSLAVAAFQSTDVGFGSNATDPATNEPLKLVGTLFKPDGAGPHPAVVLLHTCGGPAQHTTKDWPEYLTELGYVVLSIDSHGPRRISRCTDLPRGPTRVLVQAWDSLGALDYLATQPFVDIDRVAVMGFSSGASSINGVIVKRGGASSKNGRQFKAAIAVYGKCTRILAHAADDIPTLQIIAEHDPDYAPRCIGAAALDGIDAFVIKGAKHAFDMTEHTETHQDAFGTVMEYSGAATTKARELTKAFLAHHLLGLSVEKIWQQVKVKVGAAAWKALDDWLAANKQLCSKDADYFSEGASDQVRKLKSEKQIAPDFTITKFKMRRLYKKNCS